MTLSRPSRFWSTLRCWISGAPHHQQPPVLFPTQTADPDYLPLLPQQARIAAALDCALPCRRGEPLPPLPAALPLRLPISQRSGARSHPRAPARRAGR